MCDYRARQLLAHHRLTSWDTLVSQALLVVSRCTLLQTQGLPVRVENQPSWNISTVVHLLLLFHLRHTCCACRKKTGAHQVRVGLFLQSAAQRYPMSKVRLATVLACEVASVYSSPCGPHMIAKGNC